MRYKVGGTNRKAYDVVHVSSTFLIHWLVGVKLLDTNVQGLELDQCAFYVVCVTMRISLFYGKGHHHKSRDLLITLVRKELLGTRAVFFMLNRFHFYTVLSNSCLSKFFIAFIRSYRCNWCKPTTTAETARAYQSSLWCIYYRLKYHQTKERTFSIRLMIKAKVWKQRTMWKNNKGHYAVSMTY
jgi:hypothetical protein